MSSKLLLTTSFLCMSLLHADAPKSVKKESDVVINDAEQEIKLDYQSLTALILVKYGIALENNYSSQFNGETMISPRPLENPQEEYRYCEDDKSIKIHAVLAAQDKYSEKNTFNTDTRKLDDAIMHQPMPRHLSDHADIGTIKDKWTTCQRCRYHEPVSKDFIVFYNCVTQIDKTDPEAEKWAHEKIAWGKKKK